MNGDRHSRVATVEELNGAAASSGAVLCSCPDPVQDQVGISSQARIVSLSGRLALVCDANGVTRHFADGWLGRLVGILKNTVVGTYRRAAPKRSPQPKSPYVGIDIII